MKAYCLASSSAGNCFIFEFDINGIPTRLMVECGIPMSDVYKKCNEYNIQLSSVDACLITHGHGDHCCSAKEISKIMPIYAHKDTLRHIGVEGEQLFVDRPNKVLNGLFVFPFYVEHDIEGAVGFVIKTATECVIFINDNKRWTIDLRNFKPDYVFVECNYDQKFTYAQISELHKLKNSNTLKESELKEVNIKLKQLDRNVNSHSSLAGTIRGLHKLNLNHCKNIFLMHLSDRYANEHRMKNTITAEFGIRTYVCKKKGGIK